MSFQGRVAIITGGANGIGFAAAEALAQGGCQIALVDIHDQGLAAAADKLKRYSIPAASFSCDVSSKREVVGMVKSVQETFGRIDILVNSAGGSSALSREEGRDKFIAANRIESITEEEWDRVINVNLKGAFLVTQQVVPFMKERKYGRIVFLSSMAARRGAEVGNGAYAAAKAGVIGLTKQFAVEFGKYQITSNAIAPGLALSDRFSRVFHGRLSEEQRRRIESQIPLGRPSTVEEQAGVIAFLCSDAAKYINGVTIDVNGGMYVV